MYSYDEVDIIIKLKSYGTTWLNNSVASYFKVQDGLLWFAEWHG
jgi:hypothetical protein